jgi:hypothetical protein
VESPDFDNFRWVDFWGKTLVLNWTKFFLLHCLIFPYLFSVYSKGYLVL